MAVDLAATAASKRTDKIQDNIQIRQAALSYAVPVFAGLSQNAERTSEGFIATVTLIEKYLRGTDL